MSIHVPLSPVSFLARAALLYRERIAAADIIA
jgi:hypothetical protein